MPKIDASPTPNPNSMKFTTDGDPFIATAMESFNSAAQAEANPLGKALFELEHVANVFIMPTFLTVTKTPEGYWSTLIPAIKEILESKT